MASWRRYGWLLVGIMAACSALVFHRLGLVNELFHGALGSGLAGLLLFWVFAGFHFRAHWVRARSRMRKAAHARRQLQRELYIAVEDGRRSTSLLRDNLEEVSAARLPSNERLYLEGARAHANKLLEILGRCEGVGARFLLSESISRQDTRLVPSNKQPPVP